MGSEADIAKLRDELKRYQHKLDRDRRFLDFSNLLLDRYARGANARKHGQAAFRLPDFYIIGAPRCGTTWLKHALNRFPQVMMLRGEPFLFTNHFDRDHDAGLSRYEARSENFLSPKLFKVENYDCGTIGEKSPDYFLMSQARLSFFLKINPCAKFIFLCRNPGERLWSHVKHKFPDGMERLARLADLRSMEELEKHDNAVWRAVRKNSRFGFYRSAMQLWQELVPPNRLETMSFHDVEADQEAALRRVARFLSLDGDPGAHVQASRLSPRAGTEKLDPPAFLVDWMRDLYGDEPAYVDSLSHCGTGSGDT